MSPLSHDRPTCPLLCRHQPECEKGPSFEMFLWLRAWPGAVAGYDKRSVVDGGPYQPEFSPGLSMGENSIEGSD